MQAYRTFFEKYLPGADIADLDDPSGHQGSPEQILKQAATIV